MMAITFVHALWGDELVSPWPKVLRDIQIGACWRTKPDISAETLVFAYGKQNQRYLEMFGFDAILATEDAIVDFDNRGDREYDGRGPFGMFNYGISLWRHKTDAICKAFDLGVTELLWLDWDTVFCGAECMDYFGSLADGPDFQSRLRGYKNMHSGGGRKHAYHGGCYYMRSRDVCIEADRLRVESPYVTDEAVITTAVNNLYFDGKEALPQEHYEAGFDNPRLHHTRRNRLKDDDIRLYREGSLIKSAAFEVPMTTPKITYTKAGI